MTHPAGRDLDALVAEKVMGWTEVRLLSTTYDNSVWPVTVTGWVGIPPGETKEDDVDEFSTDIAAAWLVVERLGAKARRWCIGRDDEGAAWVVRTCWMSPPDREDHGRGETAPLAICRAALRAVGHG